ncbi:2-haloacid dehalogenase [Aliiroseovarius halocynthiae]|uniref:HAD family phosphatase n=1 Tax=Aliiroseovarius halocynthiae TaxID=985055 RepID=A0A545SQA7_9RHOB|nr:HAD family phosphatase [Aliiroseovarius halocynthiae]TQV67151.1 HAD family phosphatase [Aliiroseovarius halocynthiae]SMR82119.1 2-haloacid dehalogenase [Aliiroseovarius halocynthiae]
MKHVVFDIGAVLIDWNPALAWSDELGEAEARAFLDRAHFDKLNYACDAGATFAEAAGLLPDADDAARLAQYVERYGRTVPAKIAGTWDILYALKDAGVRVFAITNWSAETWPEGCKVHPELAEVFETTIVSGQVGMVKPSVAIYQHFCAKAGVKPADCIFTDDGLHNCLGAKAAGMDAIHFTGPDALAAGLKTRGIL